MVEFKDVEGYEGIYKISNTGILVNKHNKVMKTSLHKGYEIVDLRNNTKRKKRAFID